MQKPIIDIDYNILGGGNHLIGIGEAEAIRQGMLMQRAAYEPTWRALAEFVAPSRFIDSVPTERNPARKRSKQIQDSTARLSARSFVAGMMNGATSRARPWWTLIPIEEKFNNPMTDRFLFQVVNTTNKTFETSNLYNVLPQSYKDLCIFGNSAYSMLPHEKIGFLFKYFPVGSYCLGTDSEGMANQFQYDFALSVRQTVELYAKLKPSGHIDWSGMDPYVAQQYALGNYHYSVVLSTLIMPNPRPRPNSLLPEEAGKFVMYTWVRGVGNSVGNYLNPEYYSGFRYTNQRNKDNGLDPKLAALVGPTKFIDVKAFDYFPIIANRWEVAPNGDYGIESPCELALGEILSLQEMEKERKEAVAKIVRPPMKGPTSLKKAHASIISGGMTYLNESENKNANFSPIFTVDPKLNELISQKSEYQSVIRKALFEDIFLMMSNETKVSHITAAEVNEKISEKLVAIGPALGQLDRDQNSPIINNAIMLNYKVKGRMPEVPEDLRDAGFKPDYISILAQAQKASMVTAQDNFTNYAAAVSNITQNPSIIKIIDPIHLIRSRANYLGVDPKGIRTDEEFEQILAADAAKAQQQEQMGQAMAGADIASKLSKAQAEPGNMLGLYEQMGQRM
jgi:hypothetical protein